MRLTRPLALGTAALALTSMATVGAVAGHAGSSPEQPTVVDGDVALAALPALSFPAGEYMENRISDHVSLPPGTVIVFQGLPPGLTYDAATTAIRGVPTTPGVYHPVATAYLGGIPVRTESTTVTITGTASAPAPGATQPAPGQPAPQPLAGDALHYSYTSVEQHVQQLNRFTSIAAEELWLKNRRQVTVFHLVLKPLWKFGHGYVVRGGFLDGFAGLSIAAISAWGVFLKFAKLRYLGEKKESE